METKHDIGRRLWAESHPEIAAKPSMKRRKAGHDYRGKCIYMITLVVEGRRPLLGTLCGAEEGSDFPHVVPTELGRQVTREWQDIVKYPRRLWEKRNHPELFTARQGIEFGGTTVTVMGNRFLLDYPEKVLVQCSRRLSPEEINSKSEHLLALAREGTVLVSPCISPGEKEIMKRAFDEGLPQIILLENGFAPIEKPSGRQFDACAQGRLLLVAPWPHHNDRRVITREQCLQLNELCRRFCEPPARST